MKKGLIIILTLIIGFGLGWWFNEMNRFAEAVVADTNNPELDLKDSIITIKKSDIEQEDFDRFFYKFMIEPDFQISRVKFPLEFVGFKDGYPGSDTDTVYFTKDKWQHNSYYLDKQSIPIIYDNYQMKLQNTNERVFVWTGVENGINVKSFFKRIDGKWYLIKVEDLST
ncbi:DUF4348 domain-containing protein [Salinimicrobium gaetbulicola]|uniref:DUF4348 domain-containing protein n=1 Tax=Salinimicrobium gaetbulicola TaxID=999702 RepID=A0ABW3ICR1_9FLAO